MTRPIGKTQCWVLHFHINPYNITMAVGNEAFT